MANGEFFLSLVARCAAGGELVDVVCVRMEEGEKRKKRYFRLFPPPSSPSSSPF